MTEGVMVRVHHSCSECGSSDAATTYSTGWTHCFSCGGNYRSDGEYKDMSEELTEGLIEHNPSPIKSRKLTEAAPTKYGYGVGRMGLKPVQVANYRRKGKIVSQHIRDAEKNFAWVNATAGLELFGQHLWQEGGKQLIITEGEIDCLTWAQVRECRWPVVAVPGVSAIKQIKLQLEWISSFDEIVLYFDMDQPGQEFAQEVAALLPPGKVRIGNTSPYKDSNELFVEKGSKALYDTLWQAKTWRPEELLSFDEALADEAGGDRSVYFNLPFVDDLIDGLSYGELVMIGAGSNIGKSLFIKHLAYGLLEQRIPIAFFPLEEGAGQVACALNETPGVIHKEDVTFFRDTGLPLVEAVPRSIEYLAKSGGVRVFFIDHITSIFNSCGSDLKLIDTFLQTIQSLANRLGLLIIYNSHVKDPDKGSYSDGLIPNTSSFRGSGMLYRIPDVVLGLGRSIEDDERKHITTVKCLKHRQHGLLVGGTSSYTLNAGRLESTEPSDTEEDYDINDF